MRTERSDGKQVLADKPEKTAGKKRRMGRLRRIVKRPRRLAAVVLALAAVLCACTSAGAGGEKETPAPPEGASAPPAVSGEPSPAPTEGVTAPEPSQPEPASAPGPEETSAVLPPELGAAVLSDGSLPEGECVKYYCFEYGFLEYPSEADFLSAFGFEGAVPFFEHSCERIVSCVDGQERLCTDQTRLYYNEELGTGCVVQDSFYDDQSHNKWGSIFEETEQAVEPIGDNYAGFHWERWETDWLTVPQRDWGDLVEDYQEHYEYDENGRLSGFLVDGIFPSPWTTKDGRNPIYAASFSYHENGTLQYRDFGKCLEGSYQMIQHSWFDELGRVCYESCYVTHGEEYYYYIYTDDGPAPAYCLYIDHMGEGTHFAQY